MSTSCFLGNPPSIPAFRELPPKSWIFQWTPKILKFFILNPSYLLKVTKFLVKICQFEFLVMTEKNIFVYTLFLSLNTSDFSLFFCKIATPLKKVTPSFPATFLSKLRSCQTPLFWKFGRRFNPPPAERGVGVGVHTIICEYL